MLKFYVLSSAILPIFCYNDNAELPQNHKPEQPAYTGTNTKEGANMTEFRKAMEEPERLLRTGKIDEDMFIEYMYSEVQKAWKRAKNTACNIHDAKILYTIDTGFTPTTTKGNINDANIIHYHTFDEARAYIKEV